MVLLKGATNQPLQCQSPHLYLLCSAIMFVCACVHTHHVVALLPDLKSLPSETLVLHLSL